MPAAFDPPLAETLAHGDDRYPEYDTARTAPGVYVLRLAQPRTLDTLREWWHREHEITPPREIAVEAFEASAVFYVGVARQSVLSRVHDHLDNPNHSGAIMAAFPIHSVAHVYEFPDGDLAADHERQKAYEWRREHPGCFCWCDGEAV